MEEIADVEIILHQLKVMYDCYDAVDRQRTKRLCELRVRADEYRDTCETSNPHGNAQAACKSSISSADNADTGRQLLQAERR